MNTRKPLKASLLSASLLLPAIAHSAITVTNSASLTPGSDDVSYLPGAQDEANTMTVDGVNNNSGENDVLTYISERPSKGQSFTTGSNAGGYGIQTVSIQHIGWPTTFTANGSFYSVENGDTFEFRLGTISGTTLTPSFTGTATYSGATVGGLGTSGTGSFFTFDLSSEGIAALLPNTNYFFEISRGGVGAVFLELNSTAVDGYAGGTAFSGNDGGALDADNVISLPPNGGDFAFNVGLVSIPEPSTATLLGGLGLFALLRRRRA